MDASNGDIHSVLVRRTLTEEEMDLLKALQDYQVSKFGRSIVPSIMLLANVLAAIENAKNARPHDGIKPE